jgi:hypothetical protein
MSLHRCIQPASDAEPFDVKARIVALAPNKQLERTVIRPRWTAMRAAAQLRR